MPVSAAPLACLDVPLPGGASQPSMFASSGVLMEISARKRARSGAFDPAGLAAFLTQKHPVKTAAAVAALGVAPARTVQHWLAGTATPSAAALARLLVAYGPSLLAAAVPGLGWIDVVASLMQHETLCAHLDALEARRAAVIRELVGR